MNNTFTGSPSPAGSAAQGLTQSGAAESDGVESVAPTRCADHWKRQLSSAPVLNLPTDKPRPALPASRFGSRSSCVAAGLSDLLNEFSLKEHTPLSVVVLSAFQVLLLRYTSQEDIVIGCSLPGRDMRASNGSGHVQHEFVVRTDLSGDPAFRNLLQDVTAQVLEAHGGISLRQSAQPGTGPVADGGMFQVAFSGYAPSSAASPEPNLSQPLIAEVPVDLHLNVQKRGNDLYLRLFYNAELF